MAVNKEMHTNELDKDFATSFVTTRYMTGGYGAHCHRNIELYGVISGEVLATVAGESKVLKAGQIVVINCVETHEFTVKQEAEVYSLTIGTFYFVNFAALYKNKQLPRWLLDSEYNKRFFEQISPYFGFKPISELRKFAVVNNIFADMVEHYGLAEGGEDNKSHEFIETVIQYIFEHYAEDITLNSLAEVFATDPFVLSKKLSHYTGKDLRRFINDIRALKARQLMNDPSMRGVPKKEIARLCGFKTPETFYKVYKRNFFYDDPTVVD